MNNLYLDTNFFIYLSDPTSSFHQQSQEFIKYCKKHKLRLSTSCETIQEIIHWAKNTKQLSNGLSTAKKTLDIVDDLYPVYKRTIEIYLEKTSLYKSASSRDLVHLSTCIENKHDFAITFDKDFGKFKNEVRALMPEEFITLIPR